MSSRAFARYERGVRKRYHHFRRFAVGFYDPSFRELWYSRPPFIGIYYAVVSVLAGNWRPSLLTWARVEAFFVVVAGEANSPEVPERSAALFLNFRLRSDPPPHPGAGSVIDSR